MALIDVDDDKSGVREQYSLDSIILLSYYSEVRCEIEFTAEFEEWWNGLTQGEQDSVAHVVQILEAKGVALGTPYSSKVLGSKYGHMRELRIQHQGRPYRVFYAFDPERNAILLIGGDKTGDNRFYEVMVPLADAIYDEYLTELMKEKKPT